MEIQPRMGMNVGGRQVRVSMKHLPSGPFGRPETSILTGPLQREAKPHQFTPTETSILTGPLHREAKPHRFTPTETSILTGPFTPAAKGGQTTPVYPY